MNPALREPRGIALAEPHHLGDLLMTLPLAGELRRRWPRARIFYIGLPYVRSLVAACEFVDEFLDSREIVDHPQRLRELEIDIFLNPRPDDDLARAARAARVPIRPGNLLRKTAIQCNRFVAYNRTLGDHVMRFRLRHLRPLGFPRAGRDPFESDPIRLYGLTRLPPLDPRFRRLIDAQRFNLILHPKSGGNGREWPLPAYLALTRALARRGDVRLFLTGTERERDAVATDCPELLAVDGITDLMGRLPLDQFVAFVAAADGLVAGSTGPVHLAAALGRHVLGLYAAGYGLGRTAWAPIGPKVVTLQPPGACQPGKGDCPRAKGPPCPCMYGLAPERVLEALLPMIADSAAAA